MVFEGKNLNLPNEQQKLRNVFNDVDFEDISTKLTFLASNVNSNKTYGLLKKD